MQALVLVSDPLCSISPTWRETAHQFRSIYTVLEFISVRESQYPMFSYNRTHTHGLLSTIGISE